MKNDNMAIHFVKDENVKVWDLKMNLEWIRSITINNNKGMIELNNGNLICLSKNLIAWSYETKELVCNLESDGYRYYSFAYLNDNRLVGGSKGNLAFWDFNDNCNKKVYTSLLFADLKIHLIKSLNNDQYIAIVVSGTQILIWDLKLNIVKYKFLQVLGKVNALEVLDDEHLASGHDDGRIIVWNIKQESIKFDLNKKNSVKSLKLLRNIYLAAGYQDGSIIIWNLNTKLVETIQRIHREEIVGLGLLKNGLLVSGSKDGEIIEWFIS